MIELWSSKDNIDVGPHQVRSVLGYFQFDHIVPPGWIFLAAHCLHLFAESRHKKNGRQRADLASGDSVNTDQSYNLSETRK